MTIQVANFYTRESSPSNGGRQVEMGGGEGNLVEIIAVHYFIENLAVDANHDILIQQGLSSNPEHIDIGAGAFDVFPQSKAIYAKSAIISNHDGTGDTTATRWADRVRVYRLVRPRRQIWVWSILNGSAATGIWIEIYYEPFTESNAADRDRVNREFGKYRRS